MKTSTEITSELFKGATPGRKIITASSIVSESIRVSLHEKASSYLLKAWLNPAQYDATLGSSRKYSRSVYIKKNPNVRRTISSKIDNWLAELNAEIVRQRAVQIAHDACERLSYVGAPGFDDLVEQQKKIIGETTYSDMTTEQALEWAEWLENLNLFL